MVSIVQGVAEYLILFKFHINLMMFSQNLFLNLKNKRLKYGQTKN